MSVGLIALVALAGVVVGVLSALFGVGGGLVMVPFMVLALGESQHLAEGTSLLVIVPTAIIGTLVNRGNDLVDFRGAAWVGVGGVVGALAGASLALQIDGESLAKGFGVFVGVMALRTLYTGVRTLRHRE